MPRGVFPRPSVTARFWTKVDKTGTCWLWTGAKKATGYGVFRKHADQNPRPAHRLAYEELIGPVPEGLELDHLCRVRACVNPAHLEPVTGRVNILRGFSPPAQNARKTECINGHPLIPENLYLHGQRKCKTCHKAAVGRYLARRKVDAA